jgi:hypothetical protein
MASVFSYYLPSLHSSSDLRDKLTQSFRANHGIYSSHYLPDSRPAVELIHLLIATFLVPLIPQFTSSPHGTAADDADMPMGKPRRFL